MSNNQTVDQRIVEMKFNNADFEQKVSKTLESLSRLRESTKMESASKGVDELARSIKNVDVNSLTTSVTSLSQRFSTLGTIGFTVTQRLTNAMIDFGATVAKRVLSPVQSVWNIVKSKGWSRASNIKQAQFMIENLGISWEKAYKDIDDAVTGTRFGFDEAATAASQLAASGLEFGDTMPPALKAISNLASMTNSEFSDMARILTKSAAKGKVMMEELQMINERGLSGIDILSDYLHVSNENLSKMLSKGKVSFEDLVNAVNAKFGEAAKKANNTFSGVLSNNKAVFARIGQVYASGFMDAAKIVLQKTLPMLKGLEKAIKPFGEVTSALMIKFAEKLAPKIEAFGSKVENLRDKVIDILKPITDMFDIVLEKSGEATKTVEETKETIEDLTEIAKQVIRGDFGNDDARRKALEEQGKSYEKVQNKVNELLGCSFRYEVQEDKVTEATKKSTKANEKAEKQIDRLIDKEKLIEGVQKKSLKSIASSVWKHSTNLENLSYFIRGLASSVKVVRTIADDFKLMSKGASVLKKIGEFVSDAFGNFGRYLEAFNLWLLATKPWLKAVPALKEGLKGIVTRLKEAFEYAKKFENISGFAKRIKSIIDSIRESVVKLFKAITSGQKSKPLSGRLSGVFETIKNIGKFLGSSLLGGLDSVLGVVNKIIDSTSGFIGNLKNFSLLETIHNWLSKIKEVALQIIENTNISKFFADIKGFFEPLIEMVKEFFKKPEEDGPKIFERLVEWFGKFGESVKEGFAEFKEGGLVSRAVDVVKELQNAIKDLPSLVTDVINSIKSTGSIEAAKVPESIGSFIESVGKFGNDIKTSAITAVGDIFTKLADAVRKLKGFNALTPFTATLDSLAGRLDYISTRVGDWAKAANKFVTGVVEKLGGFNFKDAGIFAFLTSAAYFVFTWSRIGSNISNVFKAITTFVLNGGKVVDKAKERVKGFLQIAGALALVAGSLWVIAQIPSDRLGESVGILTGAFIAIGGVITFLSSKFTDAAKISAIGPAFLGLAGSLLIFALAIKTFSSIDPTEFASAIWKIIGAVVVLTAAVRFAGPSGIGAGVAFLGLATSLLLLLPAIKAYSKLSVDTIVKSAGAISIFLGIMTAAARLSGSGGAGGTFAAIATSLLLLAVAINVYARMKLMTLAKGGSAVIVFMTAMAIAARIAGNSTSKNLAALSVSMVVLAGAMKVLSSIPWAQLLVSAVAMSMVLGAVSKTLKTLSDLDLKLGDILKIGLQLGVVLGAVVGSLVILDKFTEGQKLLEIAASLSLVLIAVAVPIDILKDVDWTGGARAAVAVGEFLGGFILALGAIGEVVSFFESLSGRSGEGYSWLAEQARGIGVVLHEFLGGIFSGKSAEEAKSDTDMLQPIAENLKSFGETIGDFFESLSSVNDDSAARAKNIGEAILAVCAANVLEAISGWIRGKLDLSGFGESLVELAKAFVEMNDALAGKTFDLDAIDTTIEVVKKFGELANAIPKVDGIQQKIEGTADLGKFGESMKKFMDGGFRGFLTSLRLLEIDDSVSERSELVSKATMSLAKVANAIPKTGGILDRLTGISDLGSFANQMKKFMDGGFRGFLSSLRLLEIDGSVVSTIKDYVKPTTQAMIELANQIKSNKSVIEYFTGQSNLASFGQAMSDFATGLSAFSTTVRGISPARIESITAAVAKMAELNASENVKTDNLSPFSGALVNIGSALGRFTEDTSGVNPDTLGLIATKLSELHSVISTICTGDYSNAGSFAAAMETLATTGTGDFIAIIQKQTGSASDAVTAFIAACVTAANSKDLEFIKAGNKISENIYNQIKSASSLKKAASATVTLLVKVESTLRENMNKFVTKGNEVVKNFKDGIDSATLSTELNRIAVAILITEPLRHIKDELYKFEDEGENAAKGFARGIRNKADEAAEAAARMVRDAIRAAKAEQESASPSKVFRRLGNYGGEGYALGFTDMIWKVKDSVSKTGHAGILAMKDTIVKMNSMIDDEMGDGPTITPVLDLSQLASGINNTRGLLSELNGVTTDVRAAMDISSAHNESLMRKKQATNRDYTSLLDQLLENTRIINETAKQNKVAVIDGDYLFGYVDTRMGMA